MVFEPGLVHDFQSSAGRTPVMIIHQIGRVRIPSCPYTVIASNLLYGREVATNQATKIDQYDALEENEAQNYESGTAA